MGNTNCGGGNKSKEVLSTRKDRKQPPSIMEQKQGDDNTTLYSNANEIKPRKIAHKLGQEIEKASHMVKEKGSKPTTEK